VNRVEATGAQYQPITIEFDPRCGILLKDVPDYALITPAALFVASPCICWHLASGERCGEVTFLADNVTAAYAVIGYDAQLDGLACRLISSTREEAA